MAHEHNFKDFPELTNSQMRIFYFQSPHPQITENFMATVTKVTDGDTIRVETNFRDFTFPIRFLDIDTPELTEEGGQRSKDWLKNRIEGKEVEVIIDPNNRVDKWGRLLGRVRHSGISIETELLSMGLAVEFGKRNLGEIPHPEVSFPW